MTSQDDLTPEDARTYLAKKDLFQLFETNNEAVEPIQSIMAHTLDGEARMCGTWPTSPFQLHQTSSMMTALLYNRPDDPVEFLDQCIKKAKETRNIKWDSFLDVSETKSSSKTESTNLSGVKNDAKDVCNKLFRTEPELEQ